MKEKNKKSVVIAMIGAVVGIMLGIVFSNSSNLLAIIPVAGVLGGLVGTIIDRRRS